MAAYAGAFVIRDAVVKFAAVDYTNQCTRARLVPDTPIQVQRTLVPDGQVTDVDSTAWTLELSGLQDWETGGLAAYLNTNKGTLVSVTIAPRKGVGKQQAVISVRIMPPPFGGTQGEFAAFELEMPCDGQPVITAQV